MYSEKGIANQNDKDLLYKNWDQVDKVQTNFILYDYIANQISGYVSLAF